MIKIFDETTQLDNNCTKDIIYLVKRPREITNGNWGCRISLLKNGNTWYHNSNAYAHDLVGIEDFTVVKISHDKSLLFILEFMGRGHVEEVVLDTHRNICYRLLVDEHSIEPSAAWLFASTRTRESIITELAALNFNECKLTTHRVWRAPFFNQWIG